MKKMFGKILIVFGILILVILIDSMQALFFDNNVIIGIQTREMKKVGILVDTYHCGNGKHDTVIKGFSHSCSYDAQIMIFDKSIAIDNFACDTVLELFYEDINYYYSFSCIKSDYVIVRFSDGSEETVVEALKNNRIEIGDLDKFNIDYIKEEKK